MFHDIKGSDSVTFPDADVFYGMLQICLGMRETLNQASISIVRRNVGKFTVYAAVIMIFTP